MRNISYICQLNMSLLIIYDVKLKYNENIILLKKLSKKYVRRLHILYYIHLNYIIMSYFVILCIQSIHLYLFICLY